MYIESKYNKERRITQKISNNIKESKANIYNKKGVLLKGESSLPFRRVQESKPTKKAPPPPGNLPREQKKKGERMKGGKARHVKTLLIIANYCKQYEKDERKDGKKKKGKHAPGGIFTT